MNKETYTNYGDVNFIEHGGIFVEDGKNDDAEIVFIDKLVDSDLDSWLIRYGILNDGVEDIRTKLNNDEYTEDRVERIIIGKDELIEFLRDNELLGHDPVVYDAIENEVNETVLMGFKITSDLIEKLMYKVKEDNLIDDWCEEIIIDKYYGNKSFPEILAKGGSVTIKKYDNPNKYTLSTKTLISSMRVFLSDSDIDITDKITIFTLDNKDLISVIDYILIPALRVNI